MLKFSPEISTTVRLYEDPPGGAEMAFTSDVRTGQSGSAEDWVNAFAHVWERPKERLDALLALLSDDVVLRGPVKPPVTEGKTDSARAFRRYLRALPDLRGEVRRWSYRQGALFIEMEFEATIGGHKVRWPNVDRFLFEKGEAVERVAFFDSAVLQKAFTRNLRAVIQGLKVRGIL